MNRSLPSNGSRSLGLPALLFTLVLCLVAQAASRPPTEDESDIAVLPPDMDNVEIHQVRMVDGVMQADHPVIMYKEDFVSEDYDPSKNETATTVHHKKHKHSRTHHHRQEPHQEKEEEKIVFDVLPDKPIVLNDDLEAAPKKNLEEAAELVKPTKEEWLRKSHKKYHSRQRRQTYTPCSHSSYYQTPSHAVYFQPPAPPSPYYYLPAKPSQRLPVSGKKPILPGKLPIWQDKTDENPTNPMSIGSRDDFLLHNSDPAEADFSIFNQPRPNPNEISGSSGSSSASGSDRGRDNISNSPPAVNNQVWGPISNSRPVSRPSWSQTQTTSRPWDSPPVTAAPSWSRPTPRATPSPKVTNCVWAIVNCCSKGSKKIRYNCFEEFGCSGAFWGINPCADETVLDADERLGETYPLDSAVPVAESAPLAPQPSYRQDALRFPEEYDYQPGSKCQRASQLCCSLYSRNIGSLYECFLYQGCEQTLSNIVANCS
ncbi:uncharacterized protein hdly isoform X2 [Drosophila pseudoobscura]|nr:uncharacterized protein LOC4801540 isoform X2 [Drosophila pseudoobscura]XP_015037305.2 uncharacterized protein LOC4801540 isoform X2 [Drosophila pseudoobscura]XP_033238687.1 uncharacterized protein LOC4801540 isoform X2 [Drosophila pseudoobscura]